MNNQQGQAVLETTISSFVILLVFKIFFYIFIFIWMKIWSEFNLQESLVCRESQKSNSYCEIHFNKKINQARILFKVKKIQWKKSISHQSVTMSAQDFLGFQHRFHKTIPIKGDKLSFY